MWRAGANFRRRALLCFGWAWCRRVDLHDAGNERRFIFSYMPSSRWRRSRSDERASFQSVAHTRKRALIAYRCALRGVRRIRRSVDWILCAVSPNVRLAAFGGRDTAVLYVNKCHAVRVRSRGGGNRE